MKLAIITGATKGLGRSLAEVFLQNGYMVLGTYHLDDAAAAEFTASSNKNNLPLHLLKADVADTKCPEWLVQQISEMQPTEIVLVHNACAAFHPTPFHLTQLQDFQAQWSTSVHGPVMLTRALLKQIVRVEKGAIVGILTTALAEPQPSGFSAYLSAKAALQSMLKSIANEMVSGSVKVFTVSPGFMDTPLTQAWHHALRKSAELYTTDVANEVFRLVADTATKGKGEDYPVIK